MKLAVRHSAWLIPALAVFLPAQMAFAHFAACVGQPPFINRSTMSCFVVGAGECGGRCVETRADGGAKCAFALGNPCTGCREFPIQIPILERENSGCTYKYPFGNPCCGGGSCVCNPDFGPWRAVNSHTATSCHTWNDCTGTPPPIPTPPTTPN